MIDRLPRFFAILFLVVAFGLSGAVANAVPEEKPGAAVTDHARAIADGEVSSGARDSGDDGHSRSYDHSRGCKATAVHCTSSQTGQDSWSAVPDLHLLLVLSPSDEHLTAGGFLEVETPPPRS